MELVVFASEMALAESTFACLALAESVFAEPAFAWPVSEVQACEEPDLKEKKGISLNNSTLSRIARAGMNQ